MAYDKLEVKKSLSLDNIFELLTEWGGDPEYTEFGLLSATICHNEPGEGSRKLYYYTKNKTINNNANNKIANGRTKEKTRKTLFYMYVFMFFYIF